MSDIKPSIFRDGSNKMTIEAQDKLMNEILEDLPFDERTEAQVLRDAGLNEILAERGKTHGDYIMVAKVFKDLIDAWTWGPSELSSEQFTSLQMISMKMARIVCGDPSVRDHWDDIAGYAKLAADRCTK